MITMLESHNRRFSGIHGRHVFGASPHAGCGCESENLGQPGRVVEVRMSQDHVGHVAPGGTDVGESGGKRRLAAGGPGVNEQDPDS